MHYTYRATEDKLPEAYDHIASSGDIVLHLIYKGGRDYALICRKAEDDPAPTAEQLLQKTLDRMEHDILRQVQRTCSVIERHAAAGSK